MPDHHSQPYDDGTHTKLLIYKSYLRAWLQVFIHTKHFEGESLNFFDFFSGPGRDPDGTAGSPVILLEELKNNKSAIRSCARDIHIYFNDKTKKKTRALAAVCQEYNLPWVPTIQSRDFDDAYTDQISRIGIGPSLVFLDQCGVKHVSRLRFQELAAKKKTDIIFFFASTHQKRFSEQFDNDLTMPPGTPIELVHREVAKQYRAWAPEGYYVGDYSIRKRNGNIYGLIFGSGHHLGMFKFLSAVWNDNIGGDANFPMEAGKLQGDLFSGYQKTKIELIADEIENGILERRFTTDLDIVNFCLNRGILPSKVAKSVYSKLKKSGNLHYENGNAPRVSENVFKEPRNLILRNGR